jgi:hypothetical protein
MDRLTGITQKIQEAERQLEALRQDQRNYKKVSDTRVGDVLEDGSIVLVKGDNHAIVVCSKEREFESDWGTIMSRGWDENEWDRKFDPEWFIPSKDLLLLAHKQIPLFFGGNHRYWSSSEFNFLDAHAVNVGQNYEDVVPKLFKFSVRPFRVVTF